MTSPPARVGASRARGRRSRALAVAAVLILLPACTGDDGGDEAAPTTTTAAAAEGTTTSVTSTTEPGPGDATSRLALACNQARDRRTAVATEASDDAAVQVLAAIGRGTFPDDEVLDGWADALDDHRGDLAEVRFELADAEVSPAQADEWAVVSAAGDQEITLLADRADLLRSHDHDRITRAWPTLQGGTDQAVALALTDLGLQRGGDCELAFGGSGVPAEHREFLVAAADVCTAVVDRRRRDGFEATTTTVLDGVVAALRDDAAAVEDVDGLAAAVDEALVEWRATEADFRALDPGDAPDPAAWQQVLDVATDRVEGFQRRADALDSGDDGAIVAAFSTATAFDVPGYEGFTVLGLDQRDCGLLTS